MLITPALAQTAAPAPGGGDFFIQLVPFILIFVIMYFLIIRPQQKRLKEHREMIAAIRRGDVVVTAGGIIGKVVRVTGDSELKIEIADGIQVRVVRSTITEVRTKTEPVRERARADDDEDEGDDEESYIEEREETKPRPQPKRVAQAAAEPARKTGPAPLAPRKPATKASRPKARGKADAAVDVVRSARSPSPPAGSVEGVDAVERAAPAAPEVNGEDTSGNTKRGNA
jgi:preprotein translocase subunit YajC